MMGFSFLPTSGAGESLADFTTTQDATGRREASPSGSSKMYLSVQMSSLAYREGIISAHVAVLWLYGTTFLSLKSTKLSGSSGLFSCGFFVFTSALPERSR